MKVEMLAKGNIENILRDSSIQFNKRYSGEKYKVIELEKSDAKKLNNMLLEDAWCKFSNGAGGSPCNIFNVNGQTLIGWEASKDSYDNLIDYINDGLHAVDDEDVCNYVAGLSKVNGMTMSKLFRFYEG